MFDERWHRGRPPGERTGRQYLEGVPIRLPDRWTSVLLNQPETGMGYQVVRVTLRDGRQFDHVTVVDGILTGLPSDLESVLTDADIVDIVVTHSREPPPPCR